MNLIDEFFNKLTKKEDSSTVKNPYLDKKVSENLRLYLSEILKIKGKRILLVGEAPGYKGCKITGIPFTSGKVFNRFNHPLLIQIRDHIKLSKVESEITATIFWEYLTQKGVTPIFWNSFPFHPHPADNENKNRVPTSEEVNSGMEYLRLIYLIYEPEIVAGIGNKGFECAKKTFPDLNITYIRHPSFGGKSKFIEGMDQII